MNKKNPGDHISPERMDRFTWQKGDLKFFESEKDFFEYAEENNLKVIKYENFKDDE